MQILKTGKGRNEEIKGWQAAALDFMLYIYKLIYDRRLQAASKKRLRYSTKKCWMAA